MSQHVININSPKLGDVTVMLGYDPTDGGPFMSYEREDGDGYLSPDRLNLMQLRALALQRLGVELPATVFAAVEEDMADARMGGVDLGRRYVEYASDGSRLASCAPQ